MLPTFSERGKSLRQEAGSRVSGSPGGGAEGTQRQKPKEPHVKGRAEYSRTANTSRCPGPVRWRGLSLPPPVNTKITSKSLRWSLVMIAGFWASPAPAAVLIVDSQNGVYRKLEDALKAARAGDTIRIMPGQYRERVNLKSGVTLEAADPLNKPELTALSEVPGTWNPVDRTSGTYRLELDAASFNHLSKWRTLFVDRELVQEARWPSKASGDLMAADGTFSVTMDNNDWLSWQVASTAGAGNTNVHPPAEALNGARFVGRINSGWCWQSSTVQRVTAPAGASWKVRLTTERRSNPWWPNYDGKGAASGIGYFVGKKAFITPGTNDQEWALESEGGKNYLYLRLRGGQSPAGRKVEGKVDSWCVDSPKVLSQQDGQWVPVENAVIKHLKVFGGSVRLDGKQLVMEGCEVVHPAHFLGGGWYGSGAPEEGGVVVSGIGSRVNGCVIERSAGGGLEVAGEGHQILRTKVRDTGYAGTYYAPIAVAGQMHQVSFNSVERAGRDGIHLDGVGHIVTYNHVKNAGCVSLDFGGIYTFQSGGGAMSEIAYNWVEGQAGGGIYLDLMCQNFRVHHNVLWDNSPAGSSPNFRGLVVCGPSSGHKVYHNTIIGEIGYGKVCYVDASTDAAWKGPAFFGVNIESFNNLMLTPSEAATSLKGFTQVKKDFTPKRDATFWDRRMDARVFAVNPQKKESSVHWVKPAGVTFPYTGTPFELLWKPVERWVPKNKWGVILDFGNNQAQLDFFWKESFGHGKTLEGVNRGVVDGMPDSGAYENGLALWTPGVEGQAQEAATPRLVNVNGDCELGLREWYQMGMSRPLQLDAIQRRSGKHAITVKGRTQDWGSALQKVPVKANQKYLLTAWIKVASNGLPLTIDGTLFFKDGTRSWKGTLASASSKAGDWTLLQGDVTFADAQSIDHLQLSFTTGKNRVDFSVDDLAVVHLP